MKILYITTSYPPFMDMQTIRNLKILKTLVENGHEITVLTPNYKWLQFSKVEGITEWRTSPPFFFILQNYFSKYNILLKIINVLGNIVLFPDIFASWSWIAIRKLKEKNISQFDLLITSSGSFTSHIIGSWMTRNISIKWVADYGDPWSINKYGKSKYFLRIIEKWVLQKCNSIFFTTQSTIDSYSHNFKKEELNSNLFLVPCGFDELEIPQIKKCPNKNKRTLIYAGVAYSKDRDLTNVILSINKNTENLIFKVVGSYSSKYIKIANSHLNKSVFFKGKVDYETSINLINDSDILLHIGNYGSLQIPGKTYIYLSTPRPIIYIKQEPNYDPTYELMRKYEGILFVTNNISEIDKALKKLVSEYETYLTLSMQRVKSKSLSEYSWSSIGLNVEKIISSIQ